MMHINRWALSILFMLPLPAALTACDSPEGKSIEVTYVVTESTLVESRTVEVTRVVTETVVETDTAVFTREAAPVTSATKDLVICQAHEPVSLYPLGTDDPAANGVLHALFTNYITNLSFAHQADGLEKLPSLEDGDAVIGPVAVAAGDRVVNAAGDVVTLADGVQIINADGNLISFSGAPVTMLQMVVDFTLEPTVWSDGEPVRATDSTFTFRLSADPLTPTSKFLHTRTAGYEATGDLSLRWTGLPGFRHDQYFHSFWQPLPQHILGAFTAAELLEAETATRMPVGDGPFRIVEWVPGDHIYLKPNEFYYRGEEGMPFLDSVTFRFIPDTNHLVAELLTGQCDIGTQDGLPVQYANFLIEAEANNLLRTYFQVGTVWEHIDFGIDPERSYATLRPDWFEDVRVRRAMLMCTNRQAMVDEILYGRSTIMHTYIPPDHPLYPPDLVNWPHDLAAANALLDEAGLLDRDGDGIREYNAARVATDHVNASAWNGTPFRITLGTATDNDMQPQIARMFQEDMRRCGIEVILAFIPVSEWYAHGPEGALFGRRFDLAGFAWPTGVEPPCDLYLSDRIPAPETEWEGQNAAGFSSDSYDEACHRARAALPGTVDYETAHYRAQKIFADQVPVIPLFLRLRMAAARAEVLNFALDPTQPSELYNIYEIDLKR